MNCSQLDELEHAQRENRRLQEELDRMHAEQARLQDVLLHPQRIEAAGTLAAGLAHDMNNVLAAIMSYCEVLLDQRHAPQVQADLEQIVEQAERGAGLTRSLLAFSRKGQYRKQVLEFDALNRDALRMLAHTLPKSVEIRSRLAAGNERVNVDPVQLTQVLVNFGINASDAMDGKGVLDLTTDLVQLDTEQACRLGIEPGQHARLRFTDSGCGMGNATKQHIFEPFFTTKPRGKGTGLGLALVWGVIRGHGGAVTVESEIGRGTTFTIHLPTTRAALPVKVVRSTSTPSTTTTILLVDDEAAVRQATTRILERTGFTVIGASDGAEAIAQLARHGASIGLVVLDMGMPVMGGAECFQRLRQQSAKLPVVIATGYALDEEVQSLVAQGAAVVEKPFSSSALVVEITRMLQQSSGRGEVQMPVVARKTREL